MPIYDGVVTVAEADIPVIVELGDDVVRLSASGTEIGRWPKSECEIRHLGDATYAIEAEDETLRFVPRQPSLFAAAINGGMRPHPEPDSQRGVPRSSSAGSSSADVPPPKALTMVLFYALCVFTAALALWSIISMIF